MKIKILYVLFFCFTTKLLFCQYYGDFPKIEKEKLVRDLDLLHQGLDKFHSGMYWYTPKDSVDLAFKTAKNKIAENLNILQFNKIIAPLIGLTREDHTDIILPKNIINEINDSKKISLLPLTVVFLDGKLYCVKNASNNPANIESVEIEQINGENPKQIVSKIGSLFASDGYITNVKYSDLSGFDFSRYYYYYYGIIQNFKIKFKNISNFIELKSLPIFKIKNNLLKNKAIEKNLDSDPLEFKIINSKTAYLNIETFGNSDIKSKSKYKSIKKFFAKSFEQIREKDIENLIIDVSKNGGGTEGNEGLLYSYFGENYPKYIKVRAKSQKIILNNGIDKPIALKTFGFFEKTFFNKKMKDNSYERRLNAGYGLMAFKRKPKNRFKGNIFIIISPLTYSGGSEFVNMMYSQGLAKFIGQETGGSYYGNTSGYVRDLTLPNSNITIDIPTLQFVMNVKPNFPVGSGVIPNYEVIPTIDQYLNKENVYLEYILKLIKEK